MIHDSKFIIPNWPDYHTQITVICRQSLGKSFDFRVVIIERRVLVMCQFSHPFADNLCQLFSHAHVPFQSSITLISRNHIHPRQMARLYPNRSTINAYKQWSTSFASPQSSVEQRQQCAKWIPFQSTIQRRSLVSANCMWLPILNVGTYSSAIINLPPTSNDGDGDYVRESVPHLIRRI